MVKKEEKNNNSCFMCEVCEFYYNNEDLAQQCEDFCKANNGCNLEIIKYAVNFSQGE